MGFIAKDSGGGNFKPVPAGVFIGRCFQIIDLGTQLSEGAYGSKLQHKIRLGWEILDNDDEGTPLMVEYDGKTLPMTLSKSYTLSMHEKASLRRDLSAWRGKAFTEEEAMSFDVSKLVGAYCMLNVTHNETNGKTYSNVAGITPLPGALKASKPDPVHDVVMFDLDNPDMKVFATFHEKLQDYIKKSPEWAKATGTQVRERDYLREANSEQGRPSNGFDDMDDDIPF